MRDKTGNILTKEEGDILKLCCGHIEEEFDMKNS